MNILNTYVAHWGHLHLETYEYTNIIHLKTLTGLMSPTHLCTAGFKFPHQTCVKKGRAIWW